MARSKKVTALAAPNESVALTGAAAQRDYFNIGFKRMAEALSFEKLPMPTLGSVFKDMRTYAALLKKYEDLGKSRLVAFLKEKGHPVPDTKGKKIWEADGVLLAMHPYRTGLDPKKIEAAIRAKGKDPKKYMDTKVVYETNDDTEKKLLSDRLFTLEELKTFEYDESWVVSTPVIAVPEREE